MKYLTKLPKNCLFDKVNCGVGGTTLALNSEERYLILVPYITNVLAKEAARKGIVYDSKDMYSIPDTVSCNESYVYSGNNYETVESAQKIMATYESLPKLMKMINPSDWNLLVDECHTLIKNYELRRAAIFFIQENYSKFKSYCFMSATIPSVLPTWLSWLPKITADFERFTPTIKIETGEIKPLKYNFYNSPSGIENYWLPGQKVFYGNSNKTQYKFPKSDLKDGFGEVNWFTSVGFECIDIEDVVDEILVVVDETRLHTIVDDIDLKQIVGRFRNCQPTVRLHILTGKVATVTPITAEQLLADNNDLNYLNMIAKNAGENFTKMNTFLEMYKSLTFYDGEFRMDSNIDTYYAYLQAKIDNWKKWKNGSLISNCKNGNKSNREIKLEDIKSIEDVSQKNRALVQRAINLIGIENVRSCRTYKKLKEKMILISDDLDYRKIQQLFGLQVGRFYSNNQLRKKIDNLNLFGTISKVINFYFYADEAVKRIDGITTKGWIIKGNRG